MTKDLSVSLSIQLKQTDARARIAEIGKEFEKLGAATKAPVQEVERLKQRLGTLKGAAKLDVARDIVGVRAFRDIEREIARVEAAFKRLATSGRLSGNELAVASVAAKTKIAALRQEMAGAQTQTGTLSGAWGKLAGAWIAFQGLMAGGGVVRMVEDMQRLDARLQVSEGSMRAARVAMKEIYDIAQETGTPIRSVADAYVRFSGAIQRTGGTQQQSVKFTDALTKALKNSGASAEQTGAVMLQLGQAFDSGRLSGDEFKSVAENGGKVLTYLADALGVSRGELRKMSEEGKLTVDKLLMLSEASDQIDRDFAKLPRTVGDALTRVSNAFARMASESTALGSVLGVLAATLEFVAKNIDKVLATGLVVALAGWITSIGGVTVAFNLLAAGIGKVGVALSLLAKHPWMIAITVAITALIWSWDKLVGTVEKFSQTKLDRAQEEIGEVERGLNKMSAAVGPALERVKKGIEDTRKAAKTSVDAIVASYTAMAAQVGASASNQVATLRARYDAEKRMIAETQAHSDNRHVLEAAALIKATQDQIQITRTASQEKLAILDSEYAMRKAAIPRLLDSDRERAAALAALDQEILGKKREVLGQMMSDYREHVSQLNAEAQRHLDAVRQIEDQKRQLSMSAEEKIRALRQSTMTEYQAYQDRLRQVDELTSKARQALAAGDSQLAEEYAQKAMAATSNVGRAVTENGKEVVSQSQAAATAIQKIQAAESIAKQALDSRAQAHQTAANAATAEADSVSAAMQRVAADVDAVNTKLEAGATYVVKINSEQVEADLAKLDGLIAERETLLTVQSNIEDLRDRAAKLREELETDTESDHEVDDNVDKVLGKIRKLERDTSSTHTIYEKVIPARASGGMVQRFATGGQPSFRRMSGMISGPGTATSDSIPALLSDGEYVVRAASVRKYGAAMLAAINRGVYQPWTAPAVPSRGAVQQSGQDMRLTISGPRGAQARVSTSRDEARKLVKLLQSAGVSIA